MTYYQAVCDTCGRVDDEGEFSAWADHGSAVDQALQGGWNQLEAAPGGESFLLCEGCAETNVVRWCARCDCDLDADSWSLTDGTLTQTCELGHLTTITLKEQS